MDSILWPLGFSPIKLFLVQSRKIFFNFILNKVICKSIHLNIFHQLWRYLLKEYLCTNLMFYTSPHFRLRNQQKRQKFESFPPKISWLEERRLVGSLAEPGQHFVVNMKRVYNLLCLSWLEQLSLILSSCI
jgi:hypothetical protein